MAVVAHSQRRSKPPAPWAESASFRAKEQAAEVVETLEISFFIWPITDKRLLFNELQRRAAVCTREEPGCTTRAELATPPERDGN